MVYIYFKHRSQVHMTDPTIKLKLLYLECTIFYGGQKILFDSVVARF